MKTTGFSTSNTSVPIAAGDNTRILTQDIHSELKFIRKHWNDRQGIIEVA